MVVTAGFFSRCLIGPLPNDQNHITVNKRYMSVSLCMQKKFGGKHKIILDQTSVLFATS